MDFDPVEKLVELTKINQDTINLIIFIRKKMRQDAILGAKHIVIPIRGINASNLNYVTEKLIIAGYTISHPSAGVLKIKWI
jgi:hypothetical protein